MDLEICSLIIPILFCCNYATEKESRINLFRSAWKAVVDLLDSLPIDTNTELIPIILSYLSEIYVFAEKSSPTLSMLKFINIILAPITRNEILYQFPTPSCYSKLTEFLLNFTLRYVNWLPHNLNEEAFKVLDSVLNIIRYNMRYEHIEAIALALLDKYTMRSKIHKETVKKFIEIILDQDGFEEIGEFEAKQSYVDFFV